MYPPFWIMIGASASAFGMAVASIGISTQLFWIGIATATIEAIVATVLYMRNNG